MMIGHGRGARAELALAKAGRQAGWLALSRSQRKFWRLFAAGRQAGGRTGSAMPERYQLSLCEC